MGTSWSPQEGAMGGQQKNVGDGNCENGTKTPMCYNLHIRFESEKCARFLTS